jgi:non-ribosomal peptide synthetase component F
MTAVTENSAQLGQVRSLALWNNTRRDYLLDACVPQLVARQAAMTPDAIALISGEQTLSYGELNRQANQLGHYLQTLGAREGTLVGLCVERSLDMVVGLLGILKAGAAYLALDPSYPTERLSFILQDAKVQVLITQQLLAERLRPAKTKIICLESHKSLLNQQNIMNNLTFNVTVSNRYISFTCRLKALLL